TRLQGDWSSDVCSSDLQPPDALDIPPLMHDLIRWVGRQQKKINVVELAALLQHKFVYIHPFFDGNGRTARLIMNVLLLQKGYPRSEERRVGKECRSRRS